MGSATLGYAASYAASYATLAVGVLNLVLLAVLLRRSAAEGRTERALREESRACREEQSASARSLREELAAGQERQRQAVERQLADLRAGNERKLEEMRATVDEKLHGTLERRLGESFAQVSQRLEAVQRGLGEMQALAAGVGDLKRVLTNVKTRGIWGEYQLGAILEEVLTPDQYCGNYCPGEDGRERVEFAVRLPGRGPDGGPVYVPIDSKFPQEDYHRLLDAAERADPVALQAASDGLARAVRRAAQEIGDKYVRPPATTEFAILFLPCEGLFAEVLRQPGLVQEIQAKCHIAIVGPTTLAAFLNSLRMGFRTLALEKRSSEVWQVLGAVKVEFGRFGEVLERVKKQLRTASRSIDDTGRRTRAMERKLREVEEPPGELSASLLGLPAGDETGRNGADPPTVPADLA